MCLRSIASDLEPRAKFRTFQFVCVPKNSNLPNEIPMERARFRKCAKQVAHQAKPLQNFASHFVAACWLDLSLQSGQARISVRIARNR
jgi:hypothetical protein